MYLLARKNTVSGYAEKLEPERADSLGRICLRDTEEEAVVIDLLDVGLKGSNAMGASRTCLGVRTASRKPEGPAIKLTWTSLPATTSPNMLCASVYLPFDDGLRRSQRVRTRSACGSAAPHEALLPSLGTQHGNTHNGDMTLARTLDMRT